MSIDDPLLVPPPPPPMRRYRLDVGDGTWWELSWHPAQATFEALHLTRDELGVEQALAWHGIGVGDIASIDELIKRVDHPIPEAVVDALAADADRRYPGLPRHHHAPGNPSHEVSYQQWVAKRPERQVPHIDFGMRWSDSDMPGRHQRVSWIPDTGELYVTDHDQTYVRVLAVVPTRDELEDALAGWAAVGASPDPPLAWIEQRADLWVKDHRIGDDVPPSFAGVAAASQSAPATVQHQDVDPARLAAWEDELRGWDARLTAWAESLYAQTGTEPRWSLPAEPATETIRALLAEPAFATSDVKEFARGFDLDPQLAEQLITGRIGDLDIDQIAQLCQGLHCSPYDLWGSELARSILHAYGPERWPRHIEPLDEGRQLADADQFTRRRLDEQAEAFTEPLATVAAAWTTDDSPGSNSGPSETTVDVTCYRRTGVLALDSARHTTVVDNTAAPPDDTVEYHFSFRQTAGVLSHTVKIDSTEFATGPLPGFDVIPQLADTAHQLRGRWLIEADLVRFHDPATGADQWLGWDQDVGSWQTWDDPRRYYPGDPFDVLDPGEFLGDEVSLDDTTALQHQDPSGSESRDALFADHRYEVTNDRWIDAEYDGYHESFERDHADARRLTANHEPDPFDGPSLDL